MPILGLARLRAAVAGPIRRVARAAAARREMALREDIRREMAELRRALEMTDTPPSVLVHTYYNKLLTRISDLYHMRGPIQAGSAPVPQERVLALLRALSPYAAHSARKARFGRMGDGGYVQLDDFDGITSAISLGIGAEVSWDLAMAERGLEIFQFDNSIDAPPVASPQFRFFRATIGSDAVAGQIGLAQIVETAGVYPRRTLLKIDIEGAEWDLLAAAPPDLLRQFPQIICEFHGLADPQFFRDGRNRLDVLLKLNLHHRVIHLHGNNTAPVRLIGGSAIPDVMEVSYARADLFDWVPAAEKFPTPLDAPNEPESPEILLWHFR